MAQLYVRVEGNEVKQCWDTLPPEGAGNNGWRLAVEVRPPITPHRQGYTAHVFDLTTDPVQIVYNTYEISVDDRKSGMKISANSAFQQELYRQMTDPATFDPVKLQTAKDSTPLRIAEIDLATTHDQLDALMPNL